MLTRKPAAWLFSVVSTTSLLLAGCSGGGSDGTTAQTFDSLVLFDPVPLNSSASAIIPFPFDGLFAGFSTPTLNIPNPTNLPFVADANRQDGFSTVASLFADIAGVIDYSTVGAHIVIVNSKTGQRLVEGTDFAVHNESATAPDPLTGANTPISSQRSRLLIDLLKPLAPSTTYLAALTSGIRTASGGNVISTDVFRVVASATPVSQQTAPILAQYSQAQKDALESLREQQTRPAVVALTSVGVPESSIVLAWTFTTQSTDKALTRLAATVQPGIIRAANTGLTTTAIGGAGLADIYAGVTTVNYYLNLPDPNAPGGSTHSTAPLTGFWHADPAQPDTATSANFLGQVPCGAFATHAVVGGVTLAPSPSTTACFPVLDASTASVQTIPTLITVPHGQTRPANGWPVVIFQHGITRNRTDMLAVADGLSQAGMVVVAIDLPLHGLTDPTSPFYRNQLFTGSPAAALITGERTFDLDLENNTTMAPGPDGKIDGSGSYSINLNSLITSRDNNRQAVADLLMLTKTLATLDLNGDGTPDIDTTQIRYFGHSLGGIVGGTLLGVDRTIGAAVLANPGGGIAKLLDGSRSFGGVISAGLAAAGVAEGSDDYETFLRFAQTLIDSSDPINYAVAARANHPIELIEVANDLVVPNNVPQGAASATMDRVVEAGRLSGTDPLIAQMGLTVLGPLTTPVTTPNIVTGASLGYAVRFATGEHGSVLDPTNFPAVDAGNAERSRAVPRQRRPLPRHRRPLLMSLIKLEKQENMMKRSAIKTAIVAAFGCGAAFSASALNWEYSGVNITLDTRLSSSIVVRASNPSPLIVGIANGGQAYSVNADDGDVKYKKGDVTQFTNSITSDLSVTWKNFGLFTRGNYLYDPTLASRNFFDTADFGPGKQYGYDTQAKKNQDVQRHVGYAGKIYDLYAYGNFDLDDSHTLNLKIGKQTINWGESTLILNGLNSILAFDANRARGPGAELSEIIVPTNNVLASIGVVKNVSVEGWYQLRWEQQHHGCGGHLLLDQRLRRHRRQRRQHRLRPCWRKLAGGLELHRAATGCHLRALRRHRAAHG